MNTETNFMSFENLTKLIEEHKKETHPYKRYEFDSTSYTLLLIDINNLIKENKELKSILKSKPDTEITLQDDKGNKFVLIQSERIDMQEKLNKTIERLLNNWNELKKLLNQKYYNGERIDIKDILDKMQELEKESNSNE